MFLNEENLQHYGIKGMQWGVRRKRNSKTGRVDSEDHTRAKAIGKKKLSEMSNKELKDLTTRLNLEKQYKDLTKKETSAGQKFVQDLLINEGKRQASKFAAMQGDKAIKNAGKLLEIYKQSKEQQAKSEPFRSTSSIKIKKKKP